MTFLMCLGGHLQEDGLNVAPRVILDHVRIKGHEVGGHTVMSKADAMHWKVSNGRTHRGVDGSDGTLILL